MASVSIVDIARAAGVAPSTVSRALQGNPRISAERRAAIRALAKEMGYQPSQVARSLVTGHTFTLGVVVTDVTDPFVAEVLTGAEVAARAAGYTLLFATSHRDPEREIEAAEMLAQRQVDGMLVISSRAAERYYADGRSGPGGEATPLVLVNNGGPGSQIHSVRTDNRAGAAAAVAYLKSQGHERIAFLAGPDGGRSSRERLEGYLRGLGLAPEEAAAIAGRGSTVENVPEGFILPGSGQPEDGARSLTQLRGLVQRVTAVLCYNDLAAIGLLAAAQAAGLRVPHDLSVVGYDNIQLSAYTIPPLTTINQPTEELGRAAVELCLAALAGRTAADIVLSGELVVRQSVAPPR